ncbi:hypothetical protein C8J56DRAFT_959861 [Mycena floridula]|nr:hypothetical protein C8J56DRAFT_959861 [Mycena floridula]
MDLPEYRRLSASGPSSGLPVYTDVDAAGPSEPIAAPRPTEHVFPVLGSKSTPWATLKVSSSAKSAKSIPVLYEKEDLRCELVVEAKGQGIQAISAVVTGRMITGNDAATRYTFLKVELPIWVKNSDAGVPSSSPGANGPKLTGTCTWPFSISLPGQLPETFQQRIGVTIQYQLAVLLSRGKLRPDSHIVTPLGYVPISRPEPPSLLRQLAYQHKTLVPGPSWDPEGWHSQVMAIRGQIFKTRIVNIDFTLSLAKPLSYTRGTSIPVHSVIKSDDPHAVDLLSGAVVLTLCRTLKYFSKVSNTTTTVSWVELSDDLGKAVWSSPGVGEIPLSKNLTPTCDTERFIVQYDVVMRPFDTVSFAGTDEIICSIPVQIATMHARGPRNEFSQTIVEVEQKEEWTVPNTGGWTLAV